MAEISVSGIVRLTRDAEVKKFQSGTAYNFGVVAYRKNVREGKQTVDFFDCDIWQKTPIAGFEKDLAKGRLMYIENGQLKNNQFKGTDGSEKSKVGIHISSWEFVGDSIGKVPEPPKYGVTSEPGLVLTNKSHTVSIPVAVKQETMKISEPEFPEDAPDWAM